MPAAPPPALAVAAVPVLRDERRVQITTRRLKLYCDLKIGKWNAQWTEMRNSAAADGPPALRGVGGAARLTDGTLLDTADYARHDCLPADVTPVSDTFGKGMRVTLHHRGGVAGRPELRQVFTVYDDLPYFFVRLEIVRGAAASDPASNHLAVLALDETRDPDAGLYLGTGDDRPRTLVVPYDNDKWVRYNSDSAYTSYEATAVYDNASRHGFVLGSVTHDLWKTGITLGNQTVRKIGSLRAVSGATGDGTHDNQPHGAVTGPVVVSSQIFVGYFPDWRDGMETYGQVNGRLHPPLPWSGGVPFGWNSWSAYKETVNAPKFSGVADFLKSGLMPKGFENQGTLYVNFDSYWDNLNETQLLEAVKQTQANGQKPGIYWTPFVCWGGDLSRPVEGTNGKYSYSDILLKGADGKPLPQLDGGMPLDPTHPGTLQRIDWQMERFVRWGFDFVKLDFLTHGALEGQHFNPMVTTGTAAYNIGMKRITDALAPAKIGRPFFISLSIAPLFPAGYGHGRRISCDVFSNIDQSEYLLNSQTYGWWAGGTLYAFNDPDHTVLYRTHKESVTTEAEGRSRMNASVVSGGMMLNGDDLTDPEAQARAVRLLTNPRINALLRAGQTFRPVEGDTGSRATDVFVREDPAEKAFYVAVFNYNRNEKAAKTLSLARLGLLPGAKYNVQDLWTGQTRTAQDQLALELEPADSTILRLSRD